MKLLYCRLCYDVIKLDYITRWCKCRKVGGRYNADGYHAKYWGEFAVPLGFANSSLVQAILDQPEEGMGERFEAFVIPKECPTLRRLDGPPDDCVLQWIIDSWNRGLGYGKKQ